MTEQTVPEPTAFGAAVMDIALERGVGDPANLELRDHHHKALDDHMEGVPNHNSEDLCLRVAFAFGMDPDDRSNEQDARDLMRLSMTYTFNEALGE